MRRSLDWAGSGEGKVLKLNVIPRSASIKILKQISPYNTELISR